jgi:23S rRNA pseudouridine1911/1915/1917 synthase
VKTKRILTYKVKDLQDSELRIDKWLSQFEELGSRTKVLELIDLGLIFCEGEKISKPSLKVTQGVAIEVHIPEEAILDLVANHLPLDIVFEDSDLIVIDKPAGLVVHPSLGHNEDSLVHRLLGHCQLSSGNSNERPGVVHRLDKDTSGLIVLAKSDVAHRHLAEQFKSKSAYRIYEAICHGKLSKPSGVIKSYLNRHPVDRKKRASVRDVNKQIIRNFYENFEKGKWAVTHYKVLKEHPSGELSCVELKLETGRTHQIRVHLSELGHPIVGDTLYGADKRVGRIKSRDLKSKLATTNRILLHARELGFIHPITKDPLIFRRDWPKELLKLRDELFFSKTWGLLNRR